MALTENTPRAYEIGDFNEGPVAASAKIFAGAALGLASGNVRPLTAADTFLGFSDQFVDNSTGSAGDLRVRFRTRGAVEVPVTGASATSVGAKVYLSDDGTFTLTATDNSIMGVVKRHVSGTTCVVDFDAGRQHADA